MPIIAPSPQSTAQSLKPGAEDGVALVMVLLVMMTVSALAMSLALLASTESRVTAAYRDGMQILYGAEAALERVLPDLAAEPDFDRVLAGAAISSLTDGPPGLRRLPDATFTDLHSLTAMLNCGRVACDDDALDALREDRPWGSNNPRWQLYGYGSPFGDSRIYAVVWVADDPSETDMDPFADGGGADNPGRGRLSVMAHAFGPAGTRRVVEASVVREGQTLRIVSWRTL